MVKYDVVVADDKAVFRELAKIEIERSKDMRLVGLASNGIEAVSLVKNLLPDFLLLDNNMPGLDGVGVLKELNEANLIKRPKVIMISSFPGDDYIYSAFLNGANYCMSRDIPISIMLERGRMLLEADSAYSYEKPNNYIPPKVAKDNPNYQQHITNVLHKLGIPANLKGYEYLRRAVLIAIEDPTSLNGVTKIIYPQIASEYNTDSCNIERAIRHAIKTSWERSDARVFMEFFRPIMDKKKCRPTNSEVIATLAEYVVSYA